MGDTQEVYPLARDAAESSRCVLIPFPHAHTEPLALGRLNEQHNFLVHVTEGLIDSSIPLENITTVADVGTGTGCVYPILLYQECPYTNSIQDMAIRHPKPSKRQNPQLSTSHFPRF